MWSRGGHPMNSTLAMTLVLLISTAAYGSQEIGTEERQTEHTLVSRQGMSPARATLADFGWLVGAWTGTGLGGVSEETWSAPSAGAMMGMYRLVVKGAVSFYEFMNLAEENGSVVLRLKHFNADMTGWEEKDRFVTFRLVKLTPTEAHFGGLTFRRTGNEALDIFLALRDRNGNVREEEFNRRRVK
jgi:hypothetical protein